MDEFTHRQLVVESLNFDDQAVLARHQLVIQLRHFSLVGRLGQVVAQDVDHQIKQDYAGGRQDEEREKIYIYQKVKKNLNKKERKKKKRR